MQCHCAIVTIFCGTHPKWKFPCRVSHEIYVHHQGPISFCLETYKLQVSFSLLKFLSCTHTQCQPSVFRNLQACIQLYPRVLLKNHSTCEHLKCAKNNRIRSQLAQLFQGNMVKSLNQNFNWLTSFEIEIMKLLYLYLQLNGE